MHNNLTASFVSTFVTEDFFVDLMRLCMYPASFSVTTGNEKETMLNFFLQFYKGLKNDVIACQLPNANNIATCLSSMHTLYTVRESSPGALNNQTIFKYINKDPIIVRIVQKALSDPITSIDNFRQTLDVVTNTIHYYYELQSVSSTIKGLDTFREYVDQSNVKPFEALSKYKELVITAYNDLTKLQSLYKDETSKDYFVISDDVSCGLLSKELVNYIAKNFSVFKTGFLLFDETLDGFESSSIHLISAPSNHGKSLFTINLCYQIIKNNIKDFSSDDCILFITLEDDIYKLLRRFVSIFGNYNFNTVKKLFWTSYDTVKTIRNNESVLVNIRQVFDELLRESIVKVTQGKVHLIIKHCNENEFTSGDLSRFINRLKVDGYNTKVVFLDYIDVMSPAYSRFSGAKEYDLQGQIVQELRALSRVHHVPIVSPTQSRRESERLSSALTNEIIGDSYKKVRYTDYLYMCRMRTDKNLSSTDVKSSLIGYKDDAFDMVKYDQVLSSIPEDVLVPFEVKITKSKDSERDQVRYMLFCRQNLRIYNSIDEYVKDHIVLKINTDALEKKIVAFIDLATTDFGSDVFTFT